MNIFGIKLQSPDWKTALAPLVASTVVISVLIGMSVFGLVKPMYAAMISASALGGSLANAYGASVQKFGWRGAVTSTIFSALLIALVYLFW